jgi:transcriptional regulator with XRE-family HTH domain
MDGGALKLDRDRLQRAREMLGYGIEKTAEEAGVSKNSVLRAEHEEDIRPVTARKIAAALGVRVVDLIGEGESLKVEAPPEPTLFYELEDERRLNELRTWEQFMRNTSAQWHARIMEREELGLGLETTWIDELAETGIELARAVIQGVLRGWDEANASEREKNQVRAVIRALEYVQEVGDEAFRRTRDQISADSQKKRQAEWRRATAEIQRRLAG